MSDGISDVCSSYLPAYPCESLGLRLACPTTLSGEAYLTVVVVRNYSFGPITAVPCRAPNPSLPRTSILFRPQKTSTAIVRGEGRWWRRRVLPPGPSRLFHRPV